MQWAKHHLTDFQIKIVEKIIFLCPMNPLYHYVIQFGYPGSKMLCGQ